MTPLFVLVAFAAVGLWSPLGSPAVQSATAEEKKDQDLIQGSWRVVKLESKGKANTGSFREDTWIFQDDELRMVGKGGQGDTYVKATFKLDSSKQPRTIDLSITEGAGKGGKKRLGIYRMDGDKLTICQGVDRPKEFSGKGPAILLELERAKGK
jgi:uncharacterized protein (TIGR03067 family)